MSTIYYCDAEGCVNKGVGRHSDIGWVPPDGWSSFKQGVDTVDACSKEHADAIVAANIPEPEEEEESSENT